MIQSNFFLFAQSLSFYAKYQDNNFYSPCKGIALSRLTLILLPDLNKNILDVQARCTKGKRDDFYNKRLGAPTARRHCLPA